MGLYDITLLWADKSVILFSLTGIKGISKTDYICCDFKKVWEMTGKIFTQPIPQGKKLFKRITQCHLFGALKHTFSFFFFPPRCGKYMILPLWRLQGWEWGAGAECPSKLGSWVCNPALQINVKEKAEHEKRLSCLMKVWICADFADPSLIVKAPSPAGEKIHKHFLKFPLIVLLKPAVTDLRCSISQGQYVQPAGPHLWEWDAQASARSLISQRKGFW